ncbi:hypothetical protein E4K72_13075 [Oxalobacteraceae bacterium OM1]|nr:hypothetical protein E4K72_13075 [Oxalobacteraceae bacterium OM1]
MIEQSLRFGPEGALIGTLCLPDPARHPTIARTGIVLFNAGIVHRVGPHRINVRLARVLARIGIPSIRFDLGGLGDSGRSGGDAGFEAQAQQDIKAAMTTLGAAAGVQRFGLFGFCSGAFHSYHTALADERVTGVLLYDAFRYATPRSHLNRVLLRFRQHGVVRNTLRIAGRTLTQCMQRLKARVSSNPAARASSISFIADTTTPSDFAAGLRRLLDRQVDVAMVFAGDGFEEYNYANQFHDAMRGFGVAGRIPVAFLPEIDHVATSRDGQARLMAQVEIWARRVALPSAPVTAEPLPVSRSATPIRPAAIVLSRSVTGLGTVRSLAKAGVDVHAFYFDSHDLVRLSRYCTAMLADTCPNGDALIEKLIDYAGALGNRPVVVPTCDEHALLLARAKDRLRPFCRVLADDGARLDSLVNKDGLYAHAVAAGVQTIPYVVGPTLEEAAAWSTQHPAPYLVKPFYTGVATARIKTKNCVFQSRDELLRFVAEGSMDALIIQRLIRGGDGYIYDCYGYTDRSGHLLSMASRRRWRQNTPDFGTCTAGEIPADRSTEEVIFAGTRRLLEQIGYRGMFAVEWLLDRSSGVYYVIDFNARPAMGVAHLTAAGLNLPALAYADAVGDDLQDVELFPRLRKLASVDLLRDLESFIAKRRCKQIRTGEWLISLCRCRHFYYLDWQDPLPGIARITDVLLRILSYVARKATRRVPAESAVSATGRTS